ncbi:MAG: hypothetical protein JWR84_1010 [Caulobacter sp.]|nr:hypothetical protein [Caulobacter sp.]
MTTAEDYRAHAARCRSLTRWIGDRDACENLKRLAAECEANARRLEVESSSWAQASDTEDLSS